MKQRSVIEAVIGHLKNDGRLGRNYLKGRLGDKINAIFAAIGHNFRLLLKWFRDLLCFIFLHPFWKRFRSSLRQSLPQLLKTAFLTADGVQFTRLEP
jgi:hypothetical protein